VGESLDVNLSDGSREGGLLWNTTDEALQLWSGDPEITLTGTTVIAAHAVTRIDFRGSDEKALAKNARREQEPDRYDSVEDALRHLLATGDVGSVRLGGSHYARVLEVDDQAFHFQHLNPSGERFDEVIAAVSDVLYVQMGRIAHRRMTELLR